MKRDMQTVSRLVFLVVLTLTLTIAFSGSHSVSPAAANTTTTSGNPLQDYSTNPSLPQTGLTSILSQVDPPGIDPELLKRLRQNARGQVFVNARQSTVWRLLCGENQRGGDLYPQARGRGPKDKADAFLVEYGRLFGAQNAKSELKQTATTVDLYGNTHLEYRQSYNDVPVFATVVRVHLDQQENISAVNGVLVPNLDVNTTPTLSADEAARRAVQEVITRPPDNDADVPVQLSAGDLVIASNTLYVYRDGLIQDVPGPNLLVYEVVVTDREQYASSSSSMRILAKW